MNFQHTNLPIESEYPKLVRDKIPEIIKQNDGIDIEQRSLSDDKEFTQYLTIKIKEEAEELLHATDTVNAIEEIADIYEIIDSYIETRGLDKREIIKVQKEKAESRGGFKNRILLLSK